MGARNILKTYDCMVTPTGSKGLVCELRRTKEGKETYYDFHPLNCGKRVAFCCCPPHIDHVCDLDPCTTFCVYLGETGLILAVVLIVCLCLCVLFLGNEKFHLTEVIILLSQL